MIEIIPYFGALITIMFSIAFGYAITRGGRNKKDFGNKENELDI